eukprot:jgi/Bigna1/134915/aug1.27_g9623
MASIPFSFGSQTRVLQTRLQPRARSNVEDESKDLTEEVAMLSGMVDYYRSNYETALRQIRILRKQVYQYELQLGLAPENTTRTPPKPSFKFPERLFPGRRMGKYRWEQDMQEVRIMVPIGEDVAKADVQVSLTGTEGRKLQVEVNGQDLFEDDELSFPVRGDAVYWIFATDQDEAGAERRVIQINLEKSVRYQNWEFGFVSEDAAPDETVTDRCFIDLELGGEQGTKRLVLGLFGNTQPKTVENFLGLIKGGGSGSIMNDENGGKNGKERGGEREETSCLQLKGTSFHKIFPGVLMQGGDVLGLGGSGSRIPVYSNKDTTKMDGPSSAAISATRFSHTEIVVTWKTSLAHNSSISLPNLKLRHSRKGMIAMANDGPDSNGSQFYITFRPLPYMDGKYVVFGTIIQDEDSVLSLISRRFGSPSGIPQAPVKIADCGLLPSSTTRSTEAADSESPSS